MKLANVLVFVAVLVINALGGSGRLSGVSIGAIANRSPSYFLPADYVFGIWSVIYLGLAALTVFQALPNARGTEVATRMGPWWLVTNVLNIAWVTLFSFAQFGSALAVMVLLLLALIALNEHVLPLGTRAGIAEHVCVLLPVGMYFAWISVALIANTFQYAHIVRFGGLGVPENAWSAIMMLVATLLAWLMTFTKRMWMFPLVVAWAVWGIGARHPDVPMVGSTARLLAPLGIAVGAVALWWGTRRSRHSVTRIGRA